MIKILLPLILICFSNVSFSANNCFIRRAAFDLGSGTTKLVVADVNVCKMKIARIIFEKQQAVAYAEDLNRNNSTKFSPAIRQFGIAVIKSMMELARAKKVKSFAAVATHAFRKAENAKEFIEEITKQTSLTVHIIESRQEGILGLMAAFQKSKKKLKDIAVWDIGVIILFSSLFP